MFVARALGVIPNSLSSTRLLPAMGSLLYGILNSLSRFKGMWMGFLYTKKHGGYWWFSGNSAKGESVPKGLSRSLMRAIAKGEIWGAICDIRRT